MCVFTRRIKDERSFRACTAPDLELSHTPILSACRMPGPPVTLFFIIAVVYLNNHWRAGSTCSTLILVHSLPKCIDVRRFSRVPFFSKRRILRRVLVIVNGPLSR